VADGVLKNALVSELFSTELTKGMIRLAETEFVSNTALWRMGGPYNIDDLCLFSAWKGA